MSRAAIQLDKVSKAFGRGRTEVMALRTVSLEIGEGELALITGPSGSGKSTLLYIMSGLLRPTSGEVSVRGEAIGAMPDDALSEMRRVTIGFVFQAYNLIPSLTALENVIASRMFQGDKATERGRELLAEMGLGERTGHLPSELSGGEQQRVAIARALLNDPDIILADEPTGNLDSRAGDRIIKILGDLNRGGRTVVIATHEPGILGGGESVHFEMLDGRVTMGGR